MPRAKVVLPDRKQGKFSRSETLIDLNLRPKPEEQNSGLTSEDVGRQRGLSAARARGELEENRSWLALV